MILLEPLTLETKIYLGVAALMFLFVIYLVVWMIISTHLEFKEFKKELKAIKGKEENK